MSSLEIIDIKMTRIKSELYRVPQALPLDLPVAEQKVGITCGRKDTIAAYEVAYTLVIRDDRGKLISTTELTYLVRCRCDSDITDDQLRAFTGNVGRSVHNYLREVMQMLIARMNMPPLILDLPAGIA